jgi:predicted MFS family arabinose efflux permease
MMQLSAEGREEWRRHWRLVASACVGGSTAGLILSPFGAYIHPIEQSLHWSRAQISSGLTLYAVIGVILGPFYGRLVDKVGPRRLGVPGLLLCGGAVALLATANGSPIQWLGLWAIYAVVSQVGKPLTWTAAVSSEFVASRGPAMAFTLVGGTFAAIVSPIIATHMIEAMGWRSTLVVMSLCWAGGASLICLFWFYGRSDRLRLGRTTGGEQTRAVPALTGLSAREGLRSWRFFRLGLAVVIINALNVGLLVHMIPLLEGKGLSANLATLIASSGHVAGIAGTLLAGALVQRLPVRVVGAVFYGMPVIAYILLLMGPGTLVACAVPVLINGLAGGAMLHLYSYLTARYFGVRAYGSIFGVVAALMALAIGIGPPIAGLVYDKARSYDPFLIAGIPLVLLVATLIYSLGRAPDFGEGDGTAAAH